MIHTIVDFGFVYNLEDCTFAMLCTVFHRSSVYLSLLMSLSTLPNDGANCLNRLGLLLNNILICYSSFTKQIES